MILRWGKLLNLMKQDWSKRTSLVSQTTCYWKWLFQVRWGPCPKELVQIGFIDPILLLQAARAPEKRSYNDINDWWRGDGICSNRSLCWKWNWRWIFLECVQNVFRVCSECVVLGVSIRLNVKLNIKWCWNLVTKMAFKVCHTWTLIITVSYMDSDNESDLFRGLPHMDSDNNRDLFRGWRPGSFSKTEEEDASHEPQTWRGKIHTIKLLRVDHCCIIVVRSWAQVANIKPVRAVWVKPK